MTPESVRDLYWLSLREFDWEQTSGNQSVQSQNQLLAWEAVIRALRKDTEQEMERLRQRIRDLENILLNRIEKDAA